MGDIFHISIIPADKYCPIDMWKVNNGIPKTRDKIQNWRVKLAPYSTERSPNRQILLRPNVQPMRARTELSRWGQRPEGTRRLGPVPWDLVVVLGAEGFDVPLSVPSPPVPFSLLYWKKGELSHYY